MYHYSLQPSAWALNNGVCDHYVRSHDEDDKDAKNVRIEEFEHNTPECAYDGGDCIRFNRLYPNCLAKYPERVGGEFEYEKRFLLKKSVTNEEYLN